MNMATIMKPAVLILNPDISFQKWPFQCSSTGSRPSTSIVPMKKQIATERPVMARL